MANREFLIKLADGMAKLTITYLDQLFVRENQRSTDEIPGPVCAFGDRRDVVTASILPARRVFRGVLSAPSAQ